MDFDIKLVNHAKDYIDDLAKGINPLTKEPVNDNEIINNVKISRCLFYVSDILGEVISNGGVGRQSKPKKEDFNLEIIPLDRIVTTPIPNPISSLTNQINALKPENMKRLYATAITNWLVDIGLLEVIQINNKTYRNPTSEGLKYGITQEQRMGANGAYYINLYNEGAQRFILDNLQTVIDSGYNSYQRNNKNKADY
jgi:hypothetical protein